MAQDLQAKTFLVGIGAQKAGTTWLWSQLDRADDIFMFKGKEAHYFDAFHIQAFGDRFQRKRLEKLERIVADLRDASPPEDLGNLVARASRILMTSDVETYLNYFRAQVLPKHAVFGEITPSYALLPYDGFAAIRDCHPDVRIIFILRDPVDRLISQMRMRVRRAGAAVTSDQVLAGLNIDDVVERSTYDRTLSALDRVFEPGRVFVDFYEDMFSDAFVARLTEFLGASRFAADFDQAVHAASDDWRPEPELLATIRGRLARVYDVCRERFGDRLPASWRR
jgi:hypothetical protein